MPTSLKSGMNLIIKKFDFSFSVLLGVIILESDFTVCTEGQAITPEQSRILVRNHFS